MFEWSDLRYLLAIAKHGSTIQAARALGVNQSTVHRRIAELERRIGHVLFLRQPSGYQLSEFGHSLLPAAKKVEEAVMNLERHVVNHARELTGVIRLTCPEPLVARISTSELLAQFHARYPGLKVEFVMSDRYLDLSKGQADVALRSGEPDDEKLVGRKIGDSIWAVYASKAYVAAHGKPGSVQDIRNHSVIGFDGPLSQHRVAKWLAAVFPDIQPVARNNSVLGVLASVKSGIGIAPLPTTIADMNDDLVQVLPPIAELERGWYLLTHPDLRQTPRIRAFFDFVLAHLDMLRPVLMG